MDLKISSPDLIIVSNLPLPLWRVLLEKMTAFALHLKILLKHPRDIQHSGNLRDVFGTPKCVILLPTPVTDTNLDKTVVKRFRSDLPKVPFIYIATDGYGNNLSEVLHNQDCVPLFFAGNGDHEEWSQKLLSIISTCIEGSDDDREALRVKERETLLNVITNEDLVNHLERAKNRSDKELITLSEKRLRA